MSRRLAAVSDSPRVWARYVRVSAVMGRSGDSFHSPETQLREIDALVARSGGVGGPIFQDLDRTGRDFVRDGIQEALAWVLEDPVRRGIASYDVSRIGRNTSETLAFVKSVRAVGAVYGSSVEKIDDTPEGDLALTLWCALAELQSRTIGRRWAQTHEALAAQGKHHGVPPSGYIRERGVGLVPDPLLAGFIVEGFVRYAAGERLHAIGCDIARRSGHPHLNRQLRRILQNPAYVGRIRYDGNEMPGVHEPLVDEALYDAVQKRLAREARMAPRALAPAHSLAGLVRCAHCQAALTYRVDARVGRRSFLDLWGMRDVAVGGKGCAGVGSPRYDEVEAEVLRQITKVAKRHRDDVAARTAAQSRKTRAGLDRDVLEREAAAVQKALGELVARSALGKLSEAAYDAGAAVLEEQARVLAAQIEKATVKVEAPVSEEVVTAAEVLADLWTADGVTVDDRVALLRPLVRSIEISRAEHPYKREKIGADRVRVRFTFED